MSARIAVVGRPKGTSIFDLDGRALLFLLAVGLVEVALYAMHPNSPLTTRASNDWYGWWDQGQYFKSARAFADGDLAPENHWYAPGYALLAAVFVPLLPRNPFLLVNLASFLIFAGAFLAYFRPILGYWPTVVAFLAGLLIPPVIWVPFQLNIPFWTQFAIPWNTVPVAAAYMAILLMMRRLRDSPSPGLDFALGASAGLIAVTRPIDIVPLVLVALAYVWQRIVLQRLWVNLAIGAGGACLVMGPVIALSTAIYGGFDMPYLKVGAGIGLSIVDLPERAFAILLDASTTFGEPLSLFRAAPLLFAAVPLALAWACLDRRNGLLPIAVAAASILTYLAYNDFSPLNIFRFLLVHYIVWTVPVFLAGGLAGFLLLARRQRWVILGLLAAVTPILLASLTIDAERYPTREVAIDYAPDGSVSYQIAFPGPRVLDAVDFYGAATDNPYYLPIKEFSVRADGVELPLFKAYRPFALPGGIRFIFTRPVNARQIEIVLDDSISGRPGRPRSVVPVRFSVSVAWPWQQKPLPQLVDKGRGGRT